jgi:putative heme-binding domain-containing protein
MNRVFFLAGAALLAAGAAQGQTPRPLKDYRDYALRRDGDAGRGRALFASTEKAACAACHTVDGQGGKAGPDLRAIGDEFSRRELIEAMLEPSAAIAVGYDATIVETHSGETFTGVIKQSNAEAVALMGADGQLVSVPRATIKAQRGSPVSLMPAGLHAGLSLAEFADLVDYLVSLKQPENSLRADRGMPEVIAELATPVPLRPLFAEALRFPAPVVRRPGEARTGLVWFGALPGARDTFLAVQQTGRIWRMERTAGVFSKTVFGDFSTEVFSQRGPNGLLGVAFHPQFSVNRKYYLKHQVFEDGQIATVLVERRATADGRTDSGEPSRRLLTIPCVTQNHTGGCIEFGPDGMLYLGMGDTGPQQDPNGHGQDLRQLLGKILRIDVDRRDGERPYAIPADNPFCGRADARPEIWALGFREPWRFSFDRANGDLWVGDVGQDRVEEIAIVRRGENHGWNVYEGFEPFSNRRRQDGAVYVPPVAAYKRRYGNSVTGGYVYRGDQASSFYGVYVFGDFTSRRIWGLTQEGGRLTGLRQIALSPEGIASFATDGQGNLYVVGYEGMVYEMDFAATGFEREPAPTEAKPAPPPRRIAWERRAFPLPESIWSVAALDVNADGRRDLVAMGVTKVFALTAPEWTPETLFDAKEGKMLYCVALDANGDGATDLAVGRYQIPWIEYRNAQTKGKTLAEPTGPDFSVAWIENPRRAGATWPVHVVDRELNGIHGLAAGDVDGDGRPDVIADSISGPFFPNSVAWFSLGGKHSAPAVRHVVTQNGADGRPHYLDFADLNRDGRGDILLGDSGKGTFTWWERGANDALPWTKHLIAQEKGATNIKAGDVNGDGRSDVVGACGHGKGVFWFEGPTWTKHVIDAELATPHALAVGDFDGDGDLDVAVASYTAFIVRWYENDGRGGFTPHDIDVGHKQQAYDLKAADLDGDGRIDLILAGRETRNAVVYFNRK